MKILLIDNGTRLLRDLQELIPGHEITKKWSDVSASDALSYDLVVLSGSNANVVWNHADFEAEMALIRECKKPIIGICFGCELIAYTFGGTLKELTRPHEGVRQIEVIDPSFSDAHKIQVYEHHRWIIENMPEDFTILAKSEDGPEIIKHKTLPIYGLQFHPEHSINEATAMNVFTGLIKQLGNP